MRYGLAAVALIACSVIAQPAVAQQSEEMVRNRIEQRAAEVILVLQGKKPAAEVFSDAFLADVPEAQLLALNADLERQMGPLQGLEKITKGAQGSAMISLRFERAIASGVIQIEQVPSGLVIGLLLNDIKPLNDGVDTIRQDIAAMPGSVSVLFTPLNDGAEPILAVNADQQSAIGSTFKLYILAALARSVENGDRKWSDVVTLDRKSLPSGQLQDWAYGAPVTLHTLAAMMISVSDNTATDILFHEVGRTAIEAEFVATGHSDPERTLPFLTTLQMFGLKGSEENMRKYIAADEAYQRRILEDFDDDVRGNPNLITPPRFSDPMAIDTVEWFASGHDLRKLMQVIVSFEDPTVRQILAINPALPAARRDEWLYVGYKGGSEPGVLNLTWLLQDEAQRWHVLTMSWNNPDANVNQSELELLAQRILPLAF